MNKHHNRSEIRFLILCAAFFGVVFWFLPTSNYELSPAECEKLQKLGAEKYLQDFKFDSSWDFDTLACNSPEIIIINALHFLDTTVIILPSSELEFDFYEWAKGINPILRKQDILAFSARANFEENQIDISNLELEKTNPISIANILVHELRHLEQGINTHVPCVRHEILTCDVRLEENLFEGGAYNYNVAYLHRIIEYSALSRSQKYTASTLLTSVLETRINAISKEAREKY